MNAPVGGDDDLPWYLEGNDIDILPKNLKVQKGLAGDSSGGFNYVEEEQLPESFPLETDGSADLDIHTSSYSLNRHSERRKKRSRFEFENDNDFVPFTGSVDDLVEKARSFPVHNHCSHAEVDSMRFFARIKNNLLWWHFYALVGVAVTSTCFLTFYLQKRIRNKLKIYYGKKDLKDDIITNNQSEKELQERCGNKSEMKITHQPSEEREIQIVGYNDDRTCINSIEQMYLFSTHIPAMAEVIAKTGLNQQDSIKIATQEILSAQRRSMVDAREKEKLQLQRMQKKAGEAFNAARDNMISMSFGKNLIVCIGIGCMCRVIISHQSFVKRLWNGKDTSRHFDNVYYWFLRDICGCLDAICHKDPNTRTVTSENVVSHALAYIGLPRIHPTSHIIGRCMIKYIVQVMLLVIAHKIMNAFHSNILHQVLNIFILSFVLLGTDAGKSTIQLVLKIFGFNVMCCGLTYYGMFEFHSHGYRDLDESSIEKSPQELMNDYHNIIRRTGNLTLQLVIVARVGAFLLGCQSTV